MSLYYSFQVLIHDVKSWILLSWEGGGDLARGGAVMDLRYFVLAFEKDFK